MEVIMLADFCTNAGFILRVVVKLFKIVRWVIPILLIVLISFDLFKAFASQLDDKTKKDTFSKIVKRLIYAIIIFLVPTIINLVMIKLEPISRDNNVSETSTSWIKCWRQYYNE